MTTIAEFAGDTEAQLQEIIFGASPEKASMYYF